MLCKPRDPNARGAARSFPGQRIGAIEAQAPAPKFPSETEPRRRSKAPPRETRRWRDSVDAQVRAEDQVEGTLSTRGEPELIGVVVQVDEGHVLAPAVRVQDRRAEASGVLEPTWLEGARRPHQGRQHAAGADEEEDRGKEESRRSWPSGGALPCASSPAPRALSVGRVRHAAVEGTLASRTALPIVRRSRRSRSAGYRRRRRPVRGGRTSPYRTGDFGRDPW